MKVVDSSPRFSRKELQCKHTGLCSMSSVFLDRLEALREEYGKPIRISSGYRDPRHSIEASKSAPGVHTRGLACDIACDGQQASSSAVL